MQMTEKGALLTISILDLIRLFSLTLSGVAEINNAKAIQNMFDLFNISDFEILHLFGNSFFKILSVFHFQCSICLQILALQNLY